MDYEIFVKEAKTAINNGSWFNGSSESIFTRLDLLQELLSGARTAASNPNIDTYSMERLANVILELSAEKEQLEKIASEYVDFDTEDYLNSLPGGTVASQYRLSSAGTTDLGDDDGSLLYRTASTIENEYEGADWINFVTAGAEIWVEDQSNRLLKDSMHTREAASYYVENKTLPILDVTKRAAIIDNFVSNVEICRRAKVEINEFRSSKTARSTKIASTFVDDVVKDSFGDSINWL